MSKTIDKIKVSIFRLILKKYVLGYLVDGWEKMAGYKTQICSVLIFGIWVAESTGYLPPETASGLYKVLGGLGSYAFMQKVKRYKWVVKEVGDGLRK